MTNKANIKSVDDQWGSSHRCIRVSSHRPNSALGF